MLQIKCCDQNVATKCCWIFRPEMTIVTNITFSSLIMNSIFVQRSQRSMKRYYRCGNLNSHKPTKWTFTFRISRFYWLNICDLEVWAQPIGLVTRNCFQLSSQRWPILGLFQINVTGTVTLLGFFAIKWFAVEFVLDSKTGLGSEFER